MSRNRLISGQGFWGYPPALSTSILLDEQLNRRHMTVMRVSGSCRQFLCETVSRLGVATTTHMLKGLGLWGQDQLQRHLLRDIHLGRRAGGSHAAGGRLSDIACADGPPYRGGQ